MPQARLATGEHLSVGDIDVVVADEEVICRAAAASSLQRFGFLPQRVHEVESGDEALEKITALQSTADPAGTTSPPIMVFIDISCGYDCARQVCSLFAQKTFRREPFLISASAQRGPSSPETAFFHCSVAKTYEPTSLAHCFELCQQWWLRGGGDPLQRPSLASSQPAKGSHSSGVTTPTALSAPWKQAQGMQAASPVVQVQPPSTPSATPGGRAGNSIESLDCLLPPRPPFEDIDMICLVGRGSYGHVYRARWDISTVALKVVEHYEQGKPSMMTFEGALSASLAHPNLVQTYKYSIRDTKPARVGTAEHEGKSLAGYEVWIVQEWCGLGTLNQKFNLKEIPGQGSFPEVIEVAAEIASAASYLHSRGIIHGDLTASNVLLAERRCPKGYIAKVTDFGLARVLDRGASGIKTATMGTVTYMPPELFQLEGFALTKKVDVYAFGVILWQLCTGLVPFDGLQPTQVVVMVSQGAQLKLPATVPENLGRLFTQCCARQPADRPAFEKVVGDLLALAQLEPPPEGGFARGSWR